MAGYSSLLLAVIGVIILSSVDAGVGRPYRDCYDHLARGNARAQKTGIQRIIPRESREHMKVWCDQDTEGGGWTVIQRRVDGSVDFDLPWEDYKIGFGDLDTMKGEFWLGLDNIYKLAAQKQQELRIDLEDWEGRKAHAVFNDFEIGNEDQNYKLLRIGTYTGNAGDAMTYEINREFSTKDRDNDMWSGKCAVKHKAGWWFNKCSESLLNGEYKKGPHKGEIAGVEWKPWRGFDYSLKFAEMKLRPANKF